MKNSFLLIFVFCFFLSPIITLGQPDWTRLLQIGANGSQNINVISVNAESILFAGTITGQTTYDGENFSSIGIRDILLVKLSNSGVPLWKKQISAEANGTLTPDAIATDLSGNIYLAGTFFGTLILSGSIITSDPINNAFLAKFDSDGNAVWVKVFASTGAGSSRMAFDNQNNLFLISKTSKLIKYNSSGILQWEQTYPVRTLHTIAISGNSLYLGGTLQKSTDFGSINLPAAGSYNTGFIVEADLNGNFSKSIVVDGLKGQDGSSVSDLLIDNQGNLVITGGYTKELVLGSVAIQKTKASFYTYLAKCDPDFNFIWAKSSEELTDRYRSIWTYRLFKDNSNNFYQLGQNSCSFIFGNVSITNSYGNQFLLKFDESGNAITGSPIQNLIPDKAAINGSGQLLLAGSYNYSGSPSYGNFYLKQVNSDMSIKWETSSFNSMSAGSISINRVKHDNEGNTYIQARVLGNYDNMGIPVSTNETITLISKVDPEGNLMWLNAIPDINPENFGSTFILDKNNNILTIGLFKSKIEFGEQILTTNYNGNEGYVAKYNTYGELLWVSKFEVGEGISTNMSLTSDMAGNVIVSGVLDPANYIIKFNSNGNKLWGNLYPMESHYISLVSSDSNNNIYLTSEIHLSDGAGTTTLGSLNFTQTNNDGATALIKFDPSGNPLWAKTFGGRTGDVSPDSWPCSIKTDASGNSYIWGWAPNNAIFGNTILSIPIATNQGYNLFLTKISTNGDAVWTKAVFETKNGFNYGDLLDLDNQGNIYIGGHFRDLILIDGNEFRPEGTNDFFVMKFSDTGGFQWIKTITANSDIIRGLSVKSNNVLSLGGYAGIYGNLGIFPIYRKSGSNAMIATLGNLSTSIKRSEIADIEIYPNPASSAIYFKNLNGTASISIFDISGRRIIHQKISDGHVDIQHLAPGIYALKIENGGIISQQKFIKQ